MKRVLNLTAVLKSSDSSKQLIKYFFLGSVAFLIDAGLLLLLVNVGIYYIVANTVSFLVANCFNFVAGHYFVFNRRTRSANLFFSYLSVLAISCIGLIINNGMMYLLVDWIMFSVAVSKIFATLVGLMWNFAARKAFVYH